MKSAIDTFWSIMEFAVPLALALAYEARSRKLAGEGRPVPIVERVPAVVVTLLLASSFAYVVSRLSFRFNIPLPILFTAGNLLPQQVIITPLYRIYSGPYADVNQACAARAQSTAGAFVKRLSNDDPPGHVVTCP